MALQNREICKVGESPTTERRSLSPRRTLSIATGQEAPKMAPDPGQDADQSPRSPKLMTSSPSGSGCPTPEMQRSPSKSERKISARLLSMQKGDAKNDSGGKSPTQSTKSPKHAAWKTSKFFSRSMASGELLKGFKKITTSAAATSATAAAEEATGTTGSDGSGQHSPSAEPATRDADSKSFKSRFSSLRRKSGSDSDTVPNVDSESLKLGSPEIRGIVCKKEDLMSLMTEVSKERRCSTPMELTVPLPSNMPTSPIPALKSPSIKVAPNSPLGRSGNFRTSRSASLDPTQLPNFPPKIQLPVRTFPPRPLIRRGVAADDIGIRKSTFLEVVPEVKRRLSGPFIEIKERIVEETESEVNEGEREGAASGGDGDPAVQWDDSNFVDPNLLGGAIEAFLKGMGGTSPNHTPSTEKRVSFKKNLIK